MSRRSTGRFFTRSPAGEIPKGEGKGTAIIAPGTDVSQRDRRFRESLHLEGQSVRSGKGEFAEQDSAFRSSNAIMAKVYKDKSWFDEKECIVLDYSKTSLVAQWIRDEIREVAPGIYLGKVYWGKKKLIHFALEFPASA